MTYAHRVVHPRRTPPPPCRSFANAARENDGWVPQWSSPGSRGGMTGTLSDVTFAEAIVKLPHCGSARAAAAGYCVNASALYAGCRQNAFMVR